MLFSFITVALLGKKFFYELIVSLIFSKAYFNFLIKNIFTSDRRNNSYQDVCGHRSQQRQFNRFPIFYVLCHELGVYAKEKNWRAQVINIPQFFVVVIDVSPSLMVTSRFERKQLIKNSSWWAAIIHNSPSKLYAVSIINYTTFTNI